MAIRLVMPRWLRPVLGQRYCDEGENLRMLTDARMGRKALGEPEGIAWQMLDRKVNDHNGDTLLRTGYRAGGEMYQADTIADLAKEIGLMPPKSNWANRIDEPPFLAYPVTAGITFTFGSLQMNTVAQVLSTTGVPIQGLYA
ncbi:MAG: hypothetical protein M3386_08820, partial [Actinomycetota bacterium]|nr:hypothetical protein [Actinomycetota bacterium]